MPPCPAPDTCWCYLIRHAATDNNVAVPPRLQGRRTDPGLSAAGWEQAARTADFLSRGAMDAVYSSPLLRAQQTAAAIAGPHGLAVETRTAIIEVDVGLWEGKTWAEVEAIYPLAYRSFKADPAGCGYLEGECLNSVVERAAPALAGIMAANLGRTVAVIAHNAVNRTYLASLLGIAVSRYRDVPQDNCGINLIRYREGRARVVTINGVFHLDV